MKKYNFVTWWLDLPVKPLPYRIWKMVITPIMFILWVVFVAVYSDFYWQFSLYAVLPVAVVDFTWDGIQFYLYRKEKLKPREVVSRYGKKVQVSEKVGETECAENVDNQSEKQ